MNTQLKIETKNQKNPSHLRQDLVTRDWVLMAPSRSDRPDSFNQIIQPGVSTDTSDVLCPFQRFHLKRFPESEVLMQIADATGVSVFVLPNKYPATSTDTQYFSQQVGPYKTRPSSGFHELFLYKKHNLFLKDFSLNRLVQLLEAYGKRYIQLMKHKHIKYIQIFHNHGRKAGASVYHPHSQLIALSIVPPFVRQTLQGAETYYKKHNICVYCTMLTYEQESKDRIIYQNDDVLVITPFASKSPFQILILPKDHHSYFERIDIVLREALADAMLQTLKRLDRNLQNPDYNFVIHTSPSDGQDHKYYHWHIELIPRVTIFGGFEIGTEIYISSVSPEDAAQILRK